MLAARPRPTRSRPTPGARPGATPAVGAAQTPPATASRTAGSAPPLSSAGAGDAGVHNASQVAPSPRSASPRSPAKPSSARQLAVSARPSAQLDDRRAAPHSAAPQAAEVTRTLVAQLPVAPLSALLDPSALAQHLGRVRVVDSPAVSPRTVPVIDGPTLEALIQLGRQYLLTGAPQLAQVIFQGLVAYAPRHPGLHLCLGVAADQLGRRAEALAAFTRARALDPGCARAELNLAELALEVGERSQANLHLGAALQKAERRGDPGAADKAAALLDLLHQGSTQR